MFDKLESIEKRYEELANLIANPEIINSRYAQWQQYTKAHAELSEIVSVYRELKKIEQDLKEAAELLSTPLEPDFKEMVNLELKELEEKKKKVTQQLQLMLLPRDPYDDKNVIVEIRAGTGGEEAALFAAELFRMYTRYAEHQGWKIDLMNTNFSDLNGFKEVIFLIEGQGAYSRLKYESGAHRVQRTPVTESSGRIHTSAATVAVLPEAEEVDVNINPNDLRIDLFCSSGPGGQSVNTTQSAVRITHLPTNIIVTCQDEKSQHKNKDKAMRVLRARLLALAQEEQKEKIASTRKTQVGSGDRSERIRTYNFPQSRVTDHRINLTLHRLPEVLTGDLDEIINSLIYFFQTQQLQQI
ncbi:peptide chain release factor 1 [Peptococcaceae bacterium SCADC1_2_3]|nr:peptide chain release factor 1 [Peptococcaceae bacterium SCADC1_2_3]